MKINSIMNLYQHGDQFYNEDQFYNDDQFYNESLSTQCDGVSVCVCVCVCDMRERHTHTHTHKHLVSSNCIHTLLWLINYSKNSLYALFPKYTDMHLHHLKTRL